MFFDESLYFRHEQCAHHECQERFPGSENLPRDHRPSSDERCYELSAFEVHVFWEQRSEIISGADRIGRDV